MKIPQIRKFIAFPGYDQRILLKALFLLSLIRLGLWLLPLRTLQHILASLSSSGDPSQQPSYPPEKVASAVRAVAPSIPKATCLAQALTVQTLLAREGIQTDLALGVAPQGTTGIKAHAWLELEGMVLVGGDEKDQYIRLTRKE